MTLNTGFYRAFENGIGIACGGQNCITVQPATTTCSNNLTVSGKITANSYYTSTNSYSAYNSTVYPINTTGGSVDHWVDGWRVLQLARNSSGGQGILKIGSYLSTTPIFCSGNWAQSFATSDNADVQTTYYHANMSTGASGGHFWYNNTGNLFMQMARDNAILGMAATGTASLPSYSFIGNWNTGMYPHTTNAIGFTSGGNARMIVSSNVHVIGNINATTTVTQSDDRLKSNEQFISGSLSNILKLRPQLYTKKTKLDQVYDSNQNILVPVLPPPPRWVNSEDGSTSNLVQDEDVNETYIESGIIAQEMFYDIPEWRHLVHVPSDADSNVIYASNIPSSSNPQEDPLGYHQYWGSAPASINYIGLIPYLVDGIKELANTLNDVTTRLAAAGL